MKSLLYFSLRALLGVAIVLGTIAYSDARGWFDAPNNEFPHILKRWESMRQLHATNQPVDVLILGNSHAFTGVNPKHLSSQLGMTSFVLANNSMNWVDSYWTLREALNYCKPQVVVVDTYGLDENAAGHRNQSHTVNQIRAFVARTDPFLKLKSTLDLFSLDEIGMAWSSTIRNHHFLWENTEQLANNFERGTPMPGPDVDGLYLGRFVRFTSGLDSLNLAKYDSIPTPVDGSKMRVHEANQKAARNIAALCEENGIELMVITLPMYHRHVKAEEVWAESLREVITKEMPETPWLNLQLDTVYTHNPDYFENTVKMNQHMTYGASLRAARDIADRILAEWGPQLTRRHDDPEWRQLFQSAEGFFVYNTVIEGVDSCDVLGKDLIGPEFKIRDVLLYKDQNTPEGMKTLQFRLPDWAGDSVLAPNQNLQTQWLARYEGKVMRTLISLPYSANLSPDTLHIFKTYIRPGVEFLKLEAVSI